MANTSRTCHAPTWQLLPLDPVALEVDGGLVFGVVRDRGQVTVRVTWDVPGIPEIALVTDERLISLAPFRSVIAG